MAIFDVTGVAVIINGLFIASLTPSVAVMVIVPRKSSQLRVRVTASGLVCVPPV